MKRVLVGGVVASLLGLSVVSLAQSKPSVQGVWSVAETVGGRGAASPTAVNPKPQPGFYIFTAQHYSITRVTGDRPRLAPKDPNKPTVAELEDANRFTAQAGTYDIKGDVLTLRPSVARNPPTMIAAAPASYSLKLDGKTLTLTIKSATDGHVSVVKLARVE